MTTHSTHIFMFPFKIVGQDPDLIDKISLKVSEDKEETINKSYKISLYNQKKYFHDFALEALAINDSSEKDPKSYTSFKEIQCDKLCFNIKGSYPKNKDDEINGLLDNNTRRRRNKEMIIKEFSFKLKIEKVSLQKHSKFGVGILSIHLSNSQHKEPKDILLINQYGRRLCPPFLDKHYQDFQKDEINNELDGTKHRVLAHEIKIVDTNDGETENWEVFNEYGNYSDESEKEKNERKIKDRELENYIPKHIDYFLNRKNKDNSKIKIRPILDDRMFVMCWYGSEQLTEKFQEKKLTYQQEKKKYGMVLSDICKREKGAYEVGSSCRGADNRRVLGINPGYNGYGYVLNDFWYSFLFVDGTGKMCQNQIMQQQLTEAQTYSRWVEYNTLYGVSRYSFVILTQPLNELSKPELNAAFLKDHIETIYFRMVSLALLQRSMIIHFDKKAEEISKNFNDDEPQNELLKAVEKLTMNYTEFLNGIFHREITPQEQGIEIYDMLQKNLRVDYQAKELEREIDELHRNADIVSNRKKTEYIKKITVLGGIFLLPTFIVILGQWGHFDNIQINGWFTDMTEWIKQKFSCIFQKTYCKSFVYGKLLGTLIYVGYMVWWLFKLFFNNLNIKNIKRTGRITIFTIVSIVLTFSYTSLYNYLDTLDGFILFLIPVLTIIILELVFAIPKAIKLTRNISKKKHDI